MSLILSGTDGLSDVDGTAATPAIRGTDANTGIFFPAADTIAFSEGGAEAARIDSAGSLGIGTTSPSRLLHVQATGTGNVATFQSNAGPNLAFVGTESSGRTYLIGEGLVTAGNFSIYDSTGSAERLVIDSSGNVGIGTSSPSTRLHASGTDTNPVALRLQNTTASTGKTWQITSTNAGSLQLATIAGVADYLTVDSSGNLLVGATSVITGGKVNISGYDGASSQNGLVLKPSTATLTNYLVFYNSAGGLAGYINQTGTTTVSYGTSSDYRLKENVQPIPNALDRVLSLKPVIYSWKNTEGELGEGFLAHELQEVVPYAVSGEKDGEQMQGVDYSKLTPILTAALQEAIAKIENLEARIAVLEAK